MYLHGVFDICTLIKSFLSHMTDNWEVTSKLVVLHPFVSIDEIFQVNLLPSFLPHFLPKQNWLTLNFIAPAVLCLMHGPNYKLKKENHFAYMRKMVTCLFILTIFRLLVHQIPKTGKQFSFNKNIYALLFQIPSYENIFI